MAGWVGVKLWRMGKWPGGCMAGWVGVKLWWVDEWPGGWV